MTMVRRLAVALAMAWLALSLDGRARAAVVHPPVDSVAVVRVADSGEITMEVVHDALALALNDTSANIPDPPMFELLDGPDDAMSKALAEARERFETLCVLEVDGQRVSVTVTESPTVAEVRAWRNQRKNYPLPVTLVLRARAMPPPSARAFHIRFPEIMGPMLLVLHRPGHDELAIPLTANERSPDFALPTHTPPETAAPPSPLIEEGSASVFRRFTALGFVHIIPQGLDHCLFVLGLFLLSPRVKPVLLQISAFTLAHTITLSLSSLGLVSLPGRIIEPAIAASIAFVGIENLIATKVDAKRSVVAFLFGLIHGLGVASTFTEHGFPRGQLVPSLAAFTVGVEAGHVAVLLAAFLTLGWFRNAPWYRRRVAIPLSLLISVVALVWVIQRVMPQGPSL